MTDWRRSNHLSVCVCCGTPERGHSTLVHLCASCRGVPVKEDEQCAKCDLSAHSGSYCRPLDF